jgi:Photosynthetic reaction centre cytochrome C subunit
MRVRDRITQLEKKASREEGNLEWRELLQQVMVEHLSALRAWARQNHQPTTPCDADSMLEMVRGINTNTFNGSEKVACYTCHRGESHPKSSAQ